MMRVGELRLDHASLELRHLEDTVKITPKPFSLLQCLAERAGHVVPREEIITSLWPGQIVSDAALGSAVREVRRALKALSISDTIRVEVVRGRGYRLSTPTTRGTPEVPPPDVGEAPRPDLVGRAEELAALERALTRAAAGGPRAVLLSGSAGIGKTRLSAEFEKVATERGYRVFWGRCIEEQSVGFSVWADLVRDFARSEDPAFVRATLQSVAPELPRALPSLRALAPKPEGDSTADSELLRLGLVDGFLGLLARITEHRGCVYVLEDIHWADASSLRLLQSLAIQRTSSRMLIVATYRDDESEGNRTLHDVISDLERRNAAEPLALPPLSTEDSLRLLDTLGPKLGSSERQQELLRIAGGNPFFLHELYRHATESASDHELPEGVERLVLRRLAARSPASRSVIEAASVLGLGFEAPRVLALADDDGSGLDELVTAGLVRPVGRRGTYRFAHALHHQAVYASIPPIRRAQLHLQIATALERDAGPSVTDADTLANIAHHYDGAADVGAAAKAYRYRILAGEEARGRASFEEATLHFVRATELLEIPPGPEQPPFATDEERCDLWSSLARVARLAGETATSARALQVALPLARKLGDPARLARCVTSASFANWEDVEIIELHEHALSGLSPEPTPLRAVLLASLVQRLCHTAGAVDRQRALAEEALAISAGGGHARARHYVLEACSIGLAGRRDFAERERWADEMIGLGRSEHSPIGETQGHVFKWAVELNQGRLDRALRELEALEEIARRHPWPRISLSLHGMLWGRALLDCRLEICEEHTGAAAEMVGKVGDAGALQVMGMQVALLRRQQGRMSELRGLIDQLTQNVPGLTWLADIFRSDLGDRDALPRLLHETFEGRGGPLRHGSPAIRVIGQCWLAELCERWAEPRFAEQIARELEPSRESWAIVGAAGFGTFGSVHRALGLLEMVRGRPARAVGEFEAAGRSHRQPGARLLRLWSDFDLARALRMRDEAGDRERSAQLLDEIEGEASRSGLSFLEERLAAFRGA